MMYYYNQSAFIFDVVKGQFDFDGTGKMEFGTSQKEYSRAAERTSSDPKAGPDTRETAQYIADMLLELRNMAKSTDMKTLQG